MVRQQNMLSVKPAKAVRFTIVYDKLWETMKQRGITQYQLIHVYHISTGQLDRLRKNANISSYTMNRLCEILHCRLEDIAEYWEESGPSA